LFTNTDNEDDDDNDDDVFYSVESWFRCCHVKLWLNRSRVLLQMVAVISLSILFNVPRFLDDYVVKKQDGYHVMMRQDGLPRGEETRWFTM